MTVAQEILAEAADLVGGPRRAEHGDAATSFALIGEFWTNYLSARNGRFVSITNLDVAEMMVLFKISRVLCGTPSRDHFLDQAGYAALAGDIATAIPQATATT